MVPSPNLEKPGSAALACLALAALAFVATIAAISVLGPVPMQLYAERRSEKLELLARFSNEYCSAAFGSSHVYNAFDPRVFDKTLAQAHLQIGSLNLAVEGGSHSEQYAIARRFTGALAPASAAAASNCLIMLEANAGANTMPTHLVHPRSINLYDADVSSLVSAFATDDLGARRKYGRILHAVAAATMHYARVGMLASQIFPRALDEDLIAKLKADDRRGFLAPEGSVQESQRVSAAFAARSDAPPKRVAAATQGHVEMIARLAGSAPGAERLRYVWMVTPKLSDLSAYETYPDCVQGGGAVALIVNVARPDVFPSLYRPEMWTNPSHMSEEGAAEYSRLLAQELTRMLKLDPAVAACRGH